jgi:hypothetical protein
MSEGKQLADQICITDPCISKQLEGIENRTHSKILNQQSRKDVYFIGIAQYLQCPRGVQRYYTTLYSKSARQQKTWTSCDSVTDEQRKFEVGFLWGEYQNYDLLDFTPCNLADR